MSSLIAKLHFPPIFFLAIRYIQKVGRHTAKKVNIVLELIETPFFYRANYSVLQIKLHY